ncbi:XkdQ/YqbQ family protein [Cytobacillus massiliigabonensis]|uniref:XkdQ/YqbQ family protein n=1 Tax=Cytobacillus massiliigabonensis TaxID=1871011 RepID=UPI001C10A115|nr:hydrolase [Cytobacillus massiliigabonensis]
MANAQLIIQNGSQIMEVAAEEGVIWETTRKGVPGKLTFSVVKDEALNFQEGNAVRFIYDGVKIFYGFVFTKKRSSNDLIAVTCYDQLRYFKNKDTYVYKNKTASEFLQMLIADFNMKAGKIENTGFKIPSRIEDNKTLFDMVQSALDFTLQSTRKMYVLYDDFGAVTLQNIESMKLDLLIDEETGESFDYTSSIDSNTYNKIKLSFENKDKGTREIYIAQDSKRMNDWGILQLFETIQNNVNGKAKADALLSLYNQKTRDLSIKKAFGDPRVRAGSSLGVGLYLGDITVANYMIVENVKHTFNENEHYMDLRLIGGEFIA